ncbi:Crp/Fnr family transcriptional regulator [Mongoliitalea lutea]|uniref:cAMP-binding domain of CRP or a regulatory subunit of cAMP-dependent protein kinases n=1 Tax=Mongoliitalea lutea TaxID=849756 RepID=A0A8J3CUV8_9BACT|nr:Crp/Fnr family transcriptional regulator [Mongoliitalea lutea]GHB32317.1 hypothetical protein GCM10008106_11630 [Mongoliitalea lutea]
MEELVITKLKMIYAPLMSVDDKVYKKLAPYLQYKTYPENTILKNFGEVETSARLIVDGVICQYQLDNEGNEYAAKVYYNGQNAFDLISYTDQHVSDTLIITKTEVEIIELSKKNEEELLRHVPEVISLAIKINHLIIKEQQKWEQLLKLPKQVAYDTFLGLHKNLGTCLKVKDLQDLLGISRAHFSRIRAKKT